LTNALLQKQLQHVSSIREDDGKGRHTTTSRHLFLLPNGALLMDTPGMREFQLSAGDDDHGLAESFQDVEGLFAGCRFRDCAHQSEPGCAVRMALASGELEESRYANYLKLKRELRFQERKVNKALQSEEKQKWKKIHKAMRAR
jgi:ribosome biogenesis GTPase